MYIFIKRHSAVVIKIKITTGASRLQLTLLAGVMSRDTTVCSGHIFRLKTNQFRKNWQQCWAKVKHDGFMYYFKRKEVDRL